MNAKLSCAMSLSLALSGCAGAAAIPASQATTPSAVVTAAATFESPAPREAAIAVETPAVAQLDMSTLPEAPWASAPLAARDAPAQILEAWESAENRGWCAPIAPRTMGAAAGARARTSRLYGGWAVEFDRRGLPGLDRDGNPCEHCGRGVFGIAGTSMSPDQLVDADGEQTVLVPSYRDGSHSEIEVNEADGENVAAASITVVGQGCVYEVWSFLGADHVAALVNELRLVEQPATRDAVIARAER